MPRSTKAGTEASKKGYEEVDLDEPQTVTRVKPRLAGYLGVATTKELYDWWDSETIRPFIDIALAAKEKKFGYVPKQGKAEVSLPPFSLFPNATSVGIPTRMMPVGIPTGLANPSPLSAVPVRLC